VPKNKQINNLASWDDVETELLTPEEIAARNLRVDLMIQITHARKTNGITQKKLEEMSGVRQPVIARMESGLTSPRLDTVMKVLTALGKKLVMTDL